MLHDAEMKGAQAAKKLAREMLGRCGTGRWTRRQVSDWIDSGGNAPRLFTHDEREIKARKIRAGGARGV
jgi:hypothetical protein